MKHQILLLVFFLGMIDQINGDIALVELTGVNGADGGVTYTSLHTSVFPCEPKEGDFFYFQHIDGVTEIRCGEPPE